MRPRSVVASIAGAAILVCAASADVIVERIAPRSYANITEESVFAVTPISSRGASVTGMVVTRGATPKINVNLDDSDPKRPRMKIESDSKGVVVFARTSKKEDDHWPIITHDDVEAGADGTEWMMELVTPGATPVLRVYLLSRGSKVTIKVQGNSYDLTDLGTFRLLTKKADKTWEIGDVTRISDDAAAAQTFAAVHMQLTENEGRFLLEGPVAAHSLNSERP